MPYNFKPNLKRSRKTARKSTKRANGLTVSTRKINPYLIKTIKREFTKREEVKHNVSEFNDYIGQMNIRSSGGYGSTTFLAKTFDLVTPMQMVTGAQDAQRIGNRIRVKSWYIRYMLTYDPTVFDLGSSYEAGDITNGSQPYEITMWIISNKNNIDKPPTDAITLTAPDGFFDIGGTGVSPKSIAMDSLYKVNYNRYNVYYKRSFKIGEAGSWWYTGRNPIVPPSTTGPGDPESLPGVSNNDVKSNYKGVIALHKHVPSRFLTPRYSADDTSPNVPNNLGVYMIFTAGLFTGEQLEISDEIDPGFLLPIKLNMVDEIAYTDA